MIEVALSASEIPIEPGGRAQLTITVTNQQEHDDHVFLEIEGIDVEWYALPVPSFNVAAGVAHSAQILFKIARSSESRSETYPFLVRAKSMESGLSGVAQATLVVKGFSSLQVELNPKRAVSSYFNRMASVEVTVSNLGNHDETLDIYGSDPEDAFTYEFEPERVTVKPGHSEKIPVLIEPKTRPFIGSTRLYGYNITCRSVQDSFVSGTAHGQLERRPLFTVVTTAVALFILLAAGLALYLRPRPVVIRSFSVAPAQITAGDPVTITWDVLNANEGVYIQPENVRRSDAMGSVKVSPDRTTTYTLLAKGGGKEQQSRPVTVEVLQRPPSPKPRVDEFSVKPAKIHQGETVTLSWKVEGANLIVLNPLGLEKDPNLYQSQTNTPDTTTTYILSAKNAVGVVVKKSVTVTVVPPTQSLAEIVSFKAKPDKIVNGASATLSWRVDNAASVEITNVVGSTLKPRDSVKVSPISTTTYTLTARDNKGIMVIKDVKVTVTEPPPPVENPDNPNPTPNTGPPGIPPPGQR